MFLHGDFAVTTKLWLWLLRHCRGLQVGTLEGQGSTIQLGSDAVVPAALEHELALLPWPSNGLQGARLLQEYYALPQELLFLDIRGLDAAKGGGAAVASRFEIAFQLTKPLELPGPIDQGTFRLNCVPVINLFPASAGPIAFEGVGQDHLLRPKGLPERHAEVLGVDVVQGKESEGVARQIYLPIATRQKAARLSMRPHYRVRRELSVLGDAVDTYLSLGLGHHAPAIPEDETLSVELTCTNASLPGRLGVGDISEEDAAMQASYRNLIPVTAPMLPRLRGDVCWDLVCQRNLGMRAFDTLKALIGTLTLYDFTARTDDESQHSNRRCIQSIRSAETRSVRRLLEDIPTLGAHTALEVEESAFASQGEAFLFGCVLQELFASYLTMNSFTELELRLSPSGTEFSWAPKQGQQPLV